MRSKNRIISLIAAFSLIASSLISSIPTYSEEMPQSGETEIVPYDDVETEITSAYLTDNSDETVSGSALTAVGGTLTASLKDEYSISVSYDGDAGIPDGAELRVKEAKPEKYLDEAAEALGWSNEDYILYTRFFDISIIKDGVEIEPKTPVTVTAELLDVDEGAEALQVVHFDEGGATELESSSTDNAEVIFETGSFSVYGFGSALHTVMSEKTDVAEITVYSLASEDELKASSVSMAPPEEGFEPADAFKLADNNETVNTKLWVKAELDKNVNLPAGESYALYSIENDMPGDVIIENIAEDNGICFVGGNTSGVALMKDTGYRHMNLKLAPTASSQVTLNGLMPKNATASAVDVTDKLADDGTQKIAAYDITINDGKNEYQPNEDRPISVEISNPNISSGDDLQLWHITDSGKREQITDFAFEDGKINFKAYGFSVYEIVASDSSQGFYLYYGSGNYFSSSLNDKGCLVEKTDMSDAAVWYFERPQNQSFCYIYTYKDGKKLYIHQINSGNEIELSETAKTEFAISHASSDAFYIKHNTQNKWLQHSKGGGGIRFYTDNYNAVNCQIKMCNVIEEEFEEELELEDKSYGFMYYTSGATGNALIADEDLNYHSIVKIMIRTTGSGYSQQPIYIDQKSDVSMWNFEPISEYKYRLYTMVDGVKLYMQIKDDGVYFTDFITAEDTSSQITITPGKGANANKVQLSANGKYLYFKISTDSEQQSTFSVTADSSAAQTWLNFVKPSTIPEGSFISYTANRISVQDAIDGKKYIIYVRLWDNTDKKYNFYAIDYDGRLFPVSASGGKIEWLGDGSNELEWLFTAYKKDPEAGDGLENDNGYYELYNTFSEKYIAPQLNGQILSDNKIGVNLEGRRNGEYYTSILAWDNFEYNYAAVRASDNAEHIISTPFINADTFYFAEVEPMDTLDELHPVSTINNDLYGIKMKMIDFNGTSGDKGATEQNKYLVKTGNDKGLLKTYLKENSYPDTVYATSDAYRDLGKLYENAVPANNLFLSSVYESSGYFEYDSCQNFATLKKLEGNNEVFNTYYDADNDRTVQKFTVYKELGTTDATTATTSKHGLFLPYNVIKPGVFSTKKNEYSVHAKYNDSTVGELDESDPRKYEDLYTVGGKEETDYYFGMEMEATFVQTPSGLDSWGHDIIFEFTGDDDFWLYVDGQLVLDLGGIHSAEEAKVNFSTGEVFINGQKTSLLNIFRANYLAQGMSAAEAEEKLLGENGLFEDNEKTAEGEEKQYIFKDYTSHSMRIFYMERGAGSSNLHMRFNLSSVNPGTVQLKKELQGDESVIKNLDFELVQYPFRIFYKSEKDKPYQLLTDDDAHTTVTYQNSVQKVRFAERYRPPGFPSNYDDYTDVFFINPGKTVEINFPDEAMYYKIVECAVDLDIYDDPEVIGGIDDPSETSGNFGLIAVEGTIKDFALEGQVQIQPSAAFINKVKKDSVKSLKITKQLYNESNQLISADVDPTTFQYRLYFAKAGNETEEDIFELANRHLYFVKTDAYNGYLCKWDSVQQTFLPTAYKSVEEINNAIKDINDSTEKTDEQKAEETEALNKLITNVSFYTSINGAIANIPAGYTVEVPGLIAGTKFKVEERPWEIPVGYNLKLDDEYKGYKCEDGYVEDTDSHTDIDSYKLDPGKLENIGTVKATYTPVMNVRNKRGCGISVNKKWTDSNIVKSHAPIYFAVYVKGRLLEGSVKQLGGTDTSINFFFDGLEENCTLEDYEVREVEISNTSPTVMYDGTVSDPGTVKYVGEDSTNDPPGLSINATLLGKTTAEPFDYTVSYSKGTYANNNRVRVNDTVTNTRTGGIVVTLYDMRNGEPLANGCFTLTCGGKKVGEYVSDKNGNVTNLYDLEQGKTYVLTETAPPNGYGGLASAISFRISDDGIIEWTNGNGEAWASHRLGSGAVFEYIDIYNKPFTVEIKKTSTSGAGVAGAVFALYKQVKSSLGNYVKSDIPLTGYENLESDSEGKVVLSTVNGDKTLAPGTYYLEEKEAPQGFEKLISDIKFTISSIGKFTLDSPDEDDSVGFTVDKNETEDLNEYVINVPNEKKAGLLTLKITKNVTGTLGNKTKKFTFRAVSDSGMDVTFKLCSGESRELYLPENDRVTITEENSGYITTFKRGDSLESGNTYTFTITQDTDILVTNSLNAVLPMGVNNAVGAVFAVLGILGTFIFLLLYRQKNMSAE